MSLLKSILKIVSKTGTEDKSSPTDADEPTTPTSSELTYNEQFNSFITIRGNEEYLYFASISNYRITPTFKSPLKVKEYLSEQSLELIGTIIHVMIEINRDWTEGQNEPRGAN